MPAEVPAQRGHQPDSGVRPGLRREQDAAHEVQAALPLQHVSLTEGRTRTRGKPYGWYLLCPLFNSPTAEQLLQPLLTPLSSFMSPFINDSREKLMLWYKLCNWKEKREIMQLTLPKPVRIAWELLETAS